jgi:hypothetical protein
VFQIYFKNEINNEYIYYTLEINVENGEVVKVIEFDTMVAVSAHKKIKLVNDTKSLLNYEFSCNVNNIKALNSPLWIEPKSKVSFKKTYKLFY